MSMKPWLSVTAAICVAFFICSGADAADFKAIEWRGHQAITMSGEITDGTAAKFETAIATIKDAPHGARILLLDSPGGLVGEAFAMSEVMAKYKIHTVIPDGAKCASSCASIVFIAGKYRTVEAYGLLGQHSCSLDGLPDKKCNDILSENAVQHGVDYGAVAAFVTYIRPQDILWLSREDVDAWEISRYAGSDESNYVRLSPRLYEFMKHQKKPAQAAWRIDFREDGYRAFLRPAEDSMRELQLNLFCDESLKGRLFLSMEITGPADKIREAVLSANIATENFHWKVDKPTIWQVDRMVSELIVEIPPAHILNFLIRSKTLTVDLPLIPKYPEWISATTRLDTSRKVLAFAANHCVSGYFDGLRPPLN